MLKPLAWQADMSFGPPRDGRATFQRLDRNPRWAGLPDLDEAGMRAVGAYFRVTGQRPLTGNQVLTTWFTEAGPPPPHAALEKEAFSCLAEELTADGAG